MSERFIPAGGARQPEDDRHQLLYPVSAVLPAGEAPTKVEVRIELPPGFRRFYNQGRLNKCAGASSSGLMSLYNSPKGKFRAYDDTWLWNEAKKIDPWPDTVPGDNSGTAVRSVFDVLRAQGHVPERGETADGEGTPKLKHGVESNYWCLALDELRAVLARGEAVVCATRWYPDMFEPQERGGEWWLPARVTGQAEFGHAYLLTGWSDDREAAFTPNSWGEGWGEPGEQGGAYVPVSLLEQFAAEGWRELGAVVDRVRLRGGGGREKEDE